MGRDITDLVVFGGSSAPLPEGEHRPVAEEAPAADADEKMEGKLCINHIALEE